MNFSSSKSKMSSNARTRMTHRTVDDNPNLILPLPSSSDPTATLAVPVEIHPKAAQVAHSGSGESWRYTATSGGGTADYPKFTRNTPALPPPPWIFASTVPELLCAAATWPLRP
jgi:hypothetical protein